MAVVSNTSPLLNLAIIKHLDLVKSQFGEVIIPEVVLSEMKVNEDLPGSLELRQAIESGWLLVRSIEDRPMVTLLERTLDAGEAEAIALAIQLGADWLLLDEREGRQVARSLNLRVTGALGILLRAKQDGSIPSLNEAMRALRDLAGFRITPGLQRDLLLAAGESTAS